jgi:histidinol-phosphate aminotransferase
MIRVSSEALLTDGAYIPGLPNDYVAEAHGIPLLEVAKLGSAENPFGPSPKAAAAVEQARSRIYIYPRVDRCAFRAAIAEKFGLDLGCMVCGASGSEITEGGRT